MFAEPPYSYLKTIHQNKTAKIIMGGLVVVLLLGAALIFFINKAMISSQPGQSSPPALPKSEFKDPQSTEGPLLGVAGIIKKITRFTDEATAEAVLVMENEKQTLQVGVTSQVKVNKFAGSTSTSPPKLLTDKETWRSLVVGDQLYLASAVDLKQKGEVKANEITALDWYVKR